jgi:glycosyltransferase involved in cell wall biosynthesis
MLKWPNMQSNEGSGKRIKVLYIITKGNWGGAQKYLYTLATSLPKELYEVIVVTGEGGILKNKLEENGIKVYELSNLKRDVLLTKEYKNFLSILKIIREEKPDVLHLNSPKASGFGSLAGRLCRVPKIITTIHGWPFHEDRSDFQKILIYFFSWVTSILSTKIIVLSSQERREAESMPFLGKDKIITIGNGIEKIKFKTKASARKEITEKVNKENEKVLWLGTVSELHKNKGLEYAIKALSKINTPFLFFIIGGGEEEINLKKLINELGLEEKVFLLGFMDNASEYLKAFDIFLLSSIKEGLPYTILEAGSAGVPIIASNVGGIPDIIENGTNGILVTKGRSGEITRAIEYLINNPEKQKIFADSIKEKVLRDFSLEKMLEKTLELYNL